MKKKNVQENGYDQTPDVNVSVNINSDENINGNQHLNEPVAEESEVENLKAQVQELNDRYLRQVAEFENFKRRNARERIELVQTAGRDVITDLLYCIIKFGLTATCNENICTFCDKKLCSG